MPVMHCEWRRNYPREHPAGPRLTFGSLIVSECAGFRLPGGDPGEPSLDLEVAGCRLGQPAAHRCPRFGCGAIQLSGQEMERFALRAMDHW